MQLPHNLTLLPGVRSDHRGRRYVIGQYPSGKSVCVPYEETGAPPARTIPVPQEPKPKIRFKPVTTDSGDGRKQVVLPPRNHVLVVRWRDRVSGEHGLGKLLQFDRNEIQRVLEIECLPIMRSPDCGKTWLYVGGEFTDMHYMYHFNEGDRDPFPIKEQA